VAAVSQRGVAGCPAKVALHHPCVQSLRMQCRCLISYMYLWCPWPGCEWSAGFGAGRRLAARRARGAGPPRYRKDAARVQSDSAISALVHSAGARTSPMSNQRRALWYRAAGTLRWNIARQVRARSPNDRCTVSARFAESTAMFLTAGSRLSAQKPVRPPDQVRSVSASGRHHPYRDKVP
jgi:hypothetical protein